MGVDINSLEVKVDSSGLEKLDKAQQDAGKSAEWLEKRQAVLARIQAIEAQQAAAAAASNEKLAASQKSAAEEAEKLASASDGAAGGLSKVQMAGAAAVVALAAVVTAAIKVYGVWDGLIRKASDFQDLSEKINDTASNVASLAVAAEVGGIPLGQLVTTSNMLSKRLTGVDDESKASGASLKALGLNIKEIQAMSPVERFRAIAGAMGQFADGAGKSAVMMDLLGVTGAQIQPMMKELEEQGQRQKILTDEQIKQADDYIDAQTRMRAELDQHAQAIAVQMLPAINDLIKVVVDVVKEITAFDREAAALGAQSGVKDFADKAVIALSYLFEPTSWLITKFQTLGTLVSGLADIATSPLDQTAAKFAAMKEKIEKQSSAPSFGQRIRDQILDRQIRDMSPKYEVVKPDLDYNGRKKPERKGGGKGGGEEAAQLAYDLSQIKKSADEEIQIEHNKEQILNAERSARKVDDAQYYAAKGESIQKIADVQEAASVAAIARMKQEALTGKDAINMSRKIAEEESKINQIRQTAATQLTINKIQAADAVDKLAKSLDVARKSAQAYLDTLERQNAATLAGIGMGAKYRAELAQINAVEMRMLQERQRLDEARTRGDLKVGEYEAKLALIEKYGAMEIIIVKKHQAEMDEVRKDGNKGAYEALNNYTDMVEDQAKQWEDVTTKAFGGMEDALAEFVSTGKADFKSLADSIVKDIARIMIRQYVTGPFAAMLGGSSGGSVGDGMAGSTATFAGSILKAIGLGGGAGGWSGGGLEGTASFIGPPQFAEGTDFVPHDMYAKIHQGEAVLTKSENQKRRAANDGNGSVTNVINLHMPQGTPAESRRAAGQGAREAMAAITGAGRYR